MRYAKSRHWLSVVLSLELSDTRLTPSDVIQYGWLQPGPDWMASLCFTRLGILEYVFILVRQVQGGHPLAQGESALLTSCLSMHLHRQRETWRENRRIKEKDKKQPSRREFLCFQPFRFLLSFFFFLPFLFIMLLFSSGFILFFPLPSIFFALMLVHLVSARLGEYLLVSAGKKKNILHSFLFQYQPFISILTLQPNLLA